jgi:GDP-D-mannose dehydratase
VEDAQLDTPDEFVIASGISHSLEDFVSVAFAELDLDSREHIDHDASLRRPNDMACWLGNPSKASNLVGLEIHASSPGCYVPNANEVNDIVIPKQRRRRAACRRSEP